MEYPDLKGNWLAVTALGLNSDGSYKLWDGSDKCGTAKDWCLAAPGADIRSLLAGGGTKVESGTSVSAPHVAGAILVLRSQFPESTIPEIHQILFDTAIDLGDEGIDSTFGHGALNLGEAMTPRGALMAEMDPQLNQRTSSLNDSGITESSVTNGVLAKALSNQSIFVTDRYDRGFFASLAPRIATGSEDKQAGLRAAFTSDLPPDTRETGFGLRLNAFGASHDVTRIAHADPIMTLMSETSQTEFSMQIPSGKATLSMSSVTSTDGNAFSLGAGLPFGKGHIITVSAGHARETDSILGAKTRGAFAGLKSNTVYGRAQADFALGKHVTLNSSVTSGQTSFRSTGLLSQGRADTLAMASR